MLLGNDVPQDLINKLINNSRYYQPNSTHNGPIGMQSNPQHFPKPTQIPNTGGNLAGTTMIVFLRGIITRNQSETDEAFATIPLILEIAKSYDGFYADGSFIQHTVVPYTIGYGLGLMGNVVDFISLLIGQSVYDIWATNIAYIFQAAIKSYSPLLYNGQLLLITNGRMVSSNPFSGAKALLGYLSYLSECDGGDDQIETIKNIIKYHIVYGKPYVDHSKEQGQLINKDIMYKLEANESIIPIDHFKLYNFASMNRIVQKRPNYCFSLALRSYRIAGFEANSISNLKGWYSGDGMEYLIMKNQRQYIDFWPTVDSYQLQGTTETVAIRYSEDVPNRQLNNAKFVGGASLDNIGSIGFEFINYDKSLKYNKSWFMFDDQIVVLVSGFESDLEYKTTFVNHILENLTQQVSVDNKTIASSVITDCNNAQQVFIQGVNNQDNLAYYFLTPVNLKIVKETRTGKPSDVETTASKTEISRSFVKAYIYNATQLAYIIFPNANTSTLIQSNNCTVLSNTGSFQAVKSENFVLGNVFAGVQTVENFTFSSPVSFVLNRTGSKIVLSVSDPTQQSSLIRVRTSLNVNQNGEITFEVNAGETKTVELRVQCVNAQIINQCEHYSGFAFAYLNGSRIWYQKCPENAKCENMQLKCAQDYRQITDKPECEKIEERIKNNKCGSATRDDHPLKQLLELYIIYNQF
ncbi:hyaluronate_lyase [Hexamita inflata]|uniref:Hyaluronate lyase n=1 Tax=Hexamita inflata TaxID=28002 RepID=A0AA86TPS0_9EUKA|nr:hyaluronate lyase [Hexamita inflata]